MAKGSATEKALGGLHAKITSVFMKVLDKYEARMDAVENVVPEDLENEMLEALFDDGVMPNPAMLSAVTKFLKDNDIGFDTEKLDELSSQERRLAERRERRGNLSSLSTLKVVGNDV